MAHVARVAMRAAFLIPYVAVAAACGALAVAAPADGGPTEAQMRTAFEDMLSQQIRNALDFASEAGGPEAVALIRERGHDRFSIAAFRKRACQRHTESGSHRCEFLVDIDLVTGRMQRVLTGRFISHPAQLVFVQDV
jgi:hypothetical protein